MKPVIIPFSPATPELHNLALKKDIKKGTLFFTEDESLAKYQVFINTNNQLCYRNGIVLDSTLFDTQGPTAKTTSFKYVVLPDGRLLAAPKLIGSFKNAKWLHKSVENETKASHGPTSSASSAASRCTLIQVDSPSIKHSTLTAGEKVKCGGEFSCRNGRIASLNNESGHFQPGRDVFNQVVDALNQKNVLLKDVRLGYCLPVEGRKIPARLWVRTKARFDLWNQRTMPQSMESKEEIGEPSIGVSFS